MFDVIAVTNRHLVEGDYLSQISRLLSGGVKKLLLREKDLSQIEYLRLAQQVMKLCDSWGAVCILHNDIEAAEHLGASWLHLPLSAIRQAPGSLNKIPHVGISVHSPEQVREAETWGAGYLALGHIFATDCKAGVPPKGLSYLEDICKSTELPIYGIGGITPKNAADVIEKGAAGVCIMSWFMSASEKEVRSFLE